MFCSIHAAKQGEQAIWEIQWREVVVQSLEKIKQLIADTLGLGSRSAAMHADTPLLGHLPELDSMAVLNLITAMEDRFGIMLEDEDISASAFRTVGSLSALVDAKLAQ